MNKHVLFNIDAIGNGADSLLAVNVLWAKTPKNNRLNLLFSYHPDRVPAEKI